MGHTHPMFIRLDCHLVYLLGIRDYIAMMTRCHGTPAAPKIFTRYSALTCQMAKAMQLGRFDLPPEKSTGALCRFTDFAFSVPAEACTIPSQRQWVRKKHETGQPRSLAILLGFGPFQSFLTLLSGATCDSTPSTTIAQCVRRSSRASKSNTNHRGNCHAIAAAAELPKCHNLQAGLHAFVLQ